MEGQRNQEHYSNYNQVQEQDQIRSGNNNVDSNFFRGYSSSHDDHSGDHVHESYNNHHHHFPANRFVLDRQGGGPVGLKLEKSPLLIKELESNLNKGKKLETHEEQLVDDQPAAEGKMKATNVPAVFLKIGSWKWESENDGDLVAKFYYGRKRLIWEFLYGALKKKIEIRWPQISAINSFDKKGVLEIELNEQPEYYNEVKFEPGKHTKWEPSGDFTEGQASVCRRHKVVFRPGVLDEAFKKLLQCDSRLLNISRQPFPSCNSPLFFNQKILDFSNNTVVAHGSSSVLAISNHGSSSVPPVSNYGGSSLPVISNHGSSLVHVVSNHRSSSVPVVSNHGSSSVHPVSNHGSSSIPPVSNHESSSVLPVSNRGSSSVPPVSNRGSLSVPPVSNPGSSSVHPVSNHGSSSVPPVSNHGISSAPPVSNCGHQGTFQNLVQLTGSIVDNFNSNLQMPDLEFSNSDELAMRASFENQRVDGIREQSGNSQVEEISLDQEDHLLANHGEESLIPNQEMEVDLTNIENLADSFIPDQQQVLDIHNPNDEFEVASTCNPFRQNHQINSLQPSGGDINGFTFYDFDQFLETNNSWFPMEATIHDSNNNVGGVTNHMTYIDEDLSGVNHGSGFDNNGFSFMQPSSLPPSQFSIQDFNNSGNWVNERGYTDDRNLYSYDLSGSIGELALQNPNLGDN